MVGRLLIFVVSAASGVGGGGKGGGGPYTHHHIQRLENINRRHKALLTELQGPTY